MFEFDRNYEKFLMQYLRHEHTSWSFLEEGDERPDQPNSQTSMECCHACAESFFSILETQQLTTWADTAVYLHLLESSLNKPNSDDSVSTH